MFIRERQTRGASDLLVEVGVIGCVLLPTMSIWVNIWVEAMFSLSSKRFMRLWNPSSRMA